MELGLFMMPLHPPARPLADTLDEDLELLVEADRLGYTEAWIGEHQTLAWEPIPAPDIFIAKALALTRNIRLGPGVVLLQQHHPAMVANRIALLDHLSRGRINFGIGVGGVPTDHELLDLDGVRGDHQAMWHECIELVLKLWASEAPFDHRGKYWRVGIRKPRPEIGLGVTALFVAASLTSLPPSVDVVADRATLAEVSTRFTPQWPTLRSPSRAELPLADSEAPRTAEDVSWSEFNHHWSGLFVIAMGLLALLERTGRSPWARHWPLLFLGLAGFILVRGDPGAWPLGPKGFWESLVALPVLQHRFFAALTVTFGVFEWMVRSGHLRSPRWALVFPLLSAVAGALLLVHSHALTDLKAEFLVEATHIPLGLLAILVAGARWLEVRLSPPDNRAPGWLWTVGFTLVGVLLLLYREA